VQPAGWILYAIGPNDLRLAPLRDRYCETMPRRELPAIYPSATELMLRFKVNSAWLVLGRAVAGILLQILGRL